MITCNPCINEESKESLAAWVAHRVPKMTGADYGDFTGLDFHKDGNRIAGMIFNNYTGFDVNIHIAADSPEWAKPGVLKKIADLIFNQWGCVRITTIAGRTNKKAIKLNSGLGFVLEGIQRRGLDGKEDALIFGMLKEECKWLA